MKPDHHTPTVDTAAAYDRTNAWDNTDTDHDDGTYIAHDHCDDPKCLVCIMLPHALHDHHPDLYNNWMTRRGA